MMLYPQRLTTPTVKVRRLGYILALTRILGSEPLSNLILTKRICEWSRNNYNHLQSYSWKLPVRRKQGILVVGALTNEDAAKRYINTAREMELIVQITRKWQNTKIGNVLKALTWKENPFEPSLAQIFLLLKLILAKDYDYLSVIFENTKERINSKEAEIFQQKVKDRFHEKFKVAKETSLIKALKKAIEDVASWKKPEEYYKENIKAPRLEWLIDLKMITKWDQEFDYVCYRQNSEFFFRKEILDKNWFEKEYPCVFYECYKNLIKKPVVKWTELREDEQKELLSSLLNRSMKRFKPLAGLNKISADQFFDYSICLLLTENGILASYEELEEELINYTTTILSPYRYVRIVSEVDKGYIVKR